MKDSIDPIVAITALIGACFLCVLGPAFFLSVATGWFAGLQPMLALGLGLLLAFALYRLWLAWGARDAARIENNEGEIS